MKSKIIEMYSNGYSCQQIKDELNLIESVRTLQRMVKKSGIIRTHGDAFRLAVKQGRVTYHNRPNKQMRKRLANEIRADILFRDNYRCVLCGATSKDDRLQVDHIDGDPQNNTMSNLRTLCESCNKGEYWRGR